MVSAFTPEQIIAFLQIIQLPEQYLSKNNPSLDYALLETLHIHMISTIPYENLSLHYSPNRKISIQPEDALAKFSTGRGRGGYCMENSIFFNHILRGLGFKAYPAGVRIRLREDGVPSGPFTGWRHIVNIVTLANGERYMVDVGFGGDGATKPVPMISGQSISNLGTQEIRLVHDHIPEQTDRSERTKMWIYQYRNADNKPWNSFYAFPEMEFFLPDFEIMNWFTGSSPDSFQTYRMVIVKFLRRKVGGEDGKEEIYGKKMLVNGTIKENLGGRTQVVQECDTEDERIEALRTYFGITLTDEERDGIRGHSTELK